MERGKGVIRKRMERGKGVNKMRTLREKRSNLNGMDRIARAKEYRK